MHRSDGVAELVRFNNGRTVVQQGLSNSGPTMVQKGGPTRWSNSGPTRVVQQLSNRWWSNSGPSGCINDTRRMSAIQSLCRRAASQRTLPSSPLECNWPAALSQSPRHLKGRRGSSPGPPSLLGMARRRVPPAACACNPALVRLPPLGGIGCLARQSNLRRDEACRTRLHGQRGAHRGRRFALGVG